MRIPNTDIEAIGYGFDVVSKEDGNMSRTAADFVHIVRTKSDGIERQQMSAGTAGKEVFV